MNKYLIHNLYAIFVKFLKICKQVASNLVKAPSIGYYASQIMYYYGYNCTQSVA